jgi:hypothetical protein
MKENTKGWLPVGHQWGGVRSPPLAGGWTATPKGFFFC